MNSSSLAGFASVNVLSDVGLYAGPPVFSGDEFMSFIASWMSCGDGIVVKSNNVFAQRRVRWNINTMFVSDESVTVIFPVRVIRFESDFGVFVVLMAFDARKSLFH